MSRRPDFSQSAIKQAVLARSLQHPAVVYPAALGLIGAAGGALLLGSPLVFGAAAAAGGLAAIGFGVNFLLRKERFASDYLATANKLLIAERELTLKDLEGDLKETRSKEGLRQLERFKEKIAAFEEVLGDKLGPHELTHARFLGVAEQVYLSAIDNLRGIALAAKSSAAIDQAYISERTASLNNAKQRSKAQEQELSGLSEQLEVQRAHTEKMELLLAENEQALARLDSALAAVADMRTDPGRAALDMESAIQELQQVAERAREYQ